MLGSQLWEQTCALSTAGCSLYITAKGSRTQAAGKQRRNNTVSAGRDTQSPRARQCHGRQFEQARLHGIPLPQEGSVLDYPSKAGHGKHAPEFTSFSSKTLPLIGKSMKDKRGILDFWKQRKPAFQSQGSRLEPSCFFCRPTRHGLRRYAALSCLFQV